MWTKLGKMSCPVFYNVKLGRFWDKSQCQVSYDLTLLVVKLSVKNHQDTIRRLNITFLLFSFIFKKLYFL